MGVLAPELRQRGQQLVGFAGPERGGLGAEDDGPVEKAGHRSIIRLHSREVASFGGTGPALPRIVRWRRRAGRVSVAGASASRRASCASARGWPPPCACCRPTV